MQGAALRHLIIYTMIRQEFEDLADGVDVGADIGFLTSQLLWGGIAIGATLGVGESVRVAAAKVDESDIVVNASQQDIVGLEVKVEHLMAVQIAYDIQQLAQELVGIFLILKIVGMAGKSLCECLAVDVLHQDAVVSQGDIADEVGML